MNHLAAFCIKFTVQYFLIMLLSASNIILAENIFQKNWNNNYPPITAPSFDSFGLQSIQKTTLDVTNNQWQKITESISSSNGKPVKIKIYDNNMRASPNEYNVLYRIDPRLHRPQVFIMQLPDNLLYKDSAEKLKNNLTSEISSQAKFAIITDYFDFVSRKKIRVNQGDIVTITLNSHRFEEFSLNLEPNILTKSGIHNKIIYSPSNLFCEKFYPNLDAISGTPRCQNEKYIVDSKDEILLGFLTNDLIYEKNIPKCQKIDKDKLCKYERGLGVEIKINNDVIKDANTPLVQFNDQSLFRYTVASAGDLDFTSNLSIKNTYLENEDIITDSILNFIHIGQYSFNVSVGGGGGDLLGNKLSELEISYLISAQRPADDATGSIITDEISVQLPEGSDVWIKITNKANLLGNIDIQTIGYNGKDLIANALFEDLILPLNQTFKGLSKNLYIQLASNKVGLSLIVRSFMALYVTLYALYFLAGGINITTQELLQFFLKIVIVGIMFTDNSWRFFNDYIFKLFLISTDNLMNSVLGNNPHENSNVFSFIDPLLNFYFNKDIWFLILIEFVCFWRGSTALAILIVLAIFNIVVVIIDIIIKYILSILSICILISMAPILIVFTLFESTRPIFDNWINTLARYSLEPVFLLIFFLTIQQILMKILPYSLMDAYWSKEIPIVFTITITEDMVIRDQLSKLPGIALYVNNNTRNFSGVLSATFIVYCLSVMVVGFKNYTSSIVGTIMGGAEGASSNAGSGLMKSVNKSWGI